MIKVKQFRLLFCRQQKLKKLSTFYTPSLSFFANRPKVYINKLALCNSFKFSKDTNRWVNTSQNSSFYPNYFFQKTFYSTSCSIESNKQPLADKSIKVTTDATIPQSTDSDFAHSSPLLETFLASTENSCSTNLNHSKIWESSLWPHDLMIDLINTLHSISGQPYAITIAVTTIFIRFLALPLFISAQKNSSRLAHMRPELEMLKEKIDAAMTKNNINQIQYTNQMRELFVRYNCNPLKSLIVPLVQIPVFMSMFFALRKMPDYFPTELSKGGVLWFPNLILPDSTLVLPLLSASSFLVMVELNKEQMITANAKQGQILINVFRGLAVLMVPITMNFSSSMFCYWVTNNTYSIIQSLFFKSSKVRSYLDIWDLPKSVRDVESQSESRNDVTQNCNQRFLGEGKMKSQIELIKEHNKRVEAQRLLKKTQRQMIARQDAYDCNHHLSARQRRRAARKTTS